MSCSDGRIVKSGGKELALELEEKGYDWIKACMEAAMQYARRCEYGRCVLTENEQFLGHLDQFDRELHRLAGRLSALTRKPRAARFRDLSFPDRQDGRLAFYQRRVAYVKYAISAAPTPPEQQRNG